MNICIATSEQEFRIKAANEVAAVLTQNPNAVLGLATGQTPVGMYEELVVRYQRGEIDFSSCKTVNLDEYVGLSGGEPHSYHYFMDQHLFKHVNIQKEHTHIPDGTASNIQLECQAYNQLLDSLGGIELLVLGLGHDGHIGFNEPGTSLEGRTHCTELTKRTIDANQRFFKNRENMPKKAITMGLRDIMAAKRILLLVSGIEKAETVRAALTGPITLEIPASVLQLHHQVSVILDAAAASALTN